MTDRDLTPDEIEALKRVRAEYDEVERAFAQAIGIFTMRFADMESSLNLALGDFLGLQTMNLTTLLTSAIRNVSTRVDIFFSLTNGSRMTEELRMQLLECITEVKDLNQFRNWLLHEQFHPGMIKRSEDENGALKEWTKIRARVDEKFRWQRKDFTIEAITDASKRCSILGTTLTTLTRQYCGQRDAPRSSQ